MSGTKEYDYIIVGAGSAGCLLAYRLGADPNNRILVIEAGGPDTDPLIHIPLGLGKMHRVVELQDTAEVRGAIAKLPHMVEVVEG